jgi:hypothetical protein
MNGLLPSILCWRIEQFGSRHGTTPGQRMATAEEAVTAKGIDLIR